MGEGWTESSTTEAVEDGGEQQCSIRISRYATRKLSIPSVTVTAKYSLLIDYIICTFPAGYCSQNITVTG